MVVKGRRYFQVVEGVRVGGRVKQRVVAALGTTADPAEALGRLEREGARLRERTAGAISEREYHRIWDRMANLRARIDTLSAIVERKLIGAPPRRCIKRIRTRAIHEAGHAVARFLARCQIEYVTVDAGDESSGHVLLKKRLRRVRRLEKFRECGRTRDRIRRDLEFLCAGTAAEDLDDPERRDESLFDPVCPSVYISGMGAPGEKHDWAQAKRLIKGTDLDEDDILIACLEVKEKLRRPEAWAQVEAPAEQLVEHRTLSGEKARSICKMARAQYRASHRRPRAAGSPAA
jgi:hypothetical protein